MSPSHVETDYLIIGSGAVGLAFADTLLAETDAHITIVDRHGKPGGHWNDAELAVLRRIRHVIRLGRVQALHENEMVLARGRVPVAPDTMFIDCTASAVREKPMQPVFQGNLIVPQLVRAPLISFSAALTAYVEAHYDDEAHKNRLCTPVPFTHTLSAYPRSMLVNMSNQFQWGQDKSLRDWMRASRLDGFGKLAAGADKSDPRQKAVLARLKELAPAAMANLSSLVSSG